MLRITRIQAAADEVHLILEGRLAGPWVAELRAAALAARPAAGSLHLDLSGVRFVDGEGLSLCHRLLDQGVRLRGASPFVQELMRSGRE